jgi:serine/threonine protein kinase
LALAGLRASYGMEERDSGVEQARLERELRPDQELLRLLGEGRSGRVFLARDSRLNRLVAVKVMAPELAADRVALARFEREARAAAALAAAHRSGFVHRDLRPNNVLCDQEAGRVLVSDFGLAGVLPEVQGAVSHITGAGEVLGTPEYTSPEQLRGEDASEGSDVYALGVMGYRLLTGEGPFPTENLSAMLLTHLREPPRPIRSFRPDVDQQLAGLLERCLAKDPAKRPRAAFLAQALCKGPPTRNAEPSVAPPAGTMVRWGRLRKLSRSRLAQIIAATIVVVLALLSMVLT